MNEFIVWDEDSKEFIDENYPFYLAPTGLLCIRQNNGQMIYDNNMEYFYSIGKKDISDKKIYADSSIFEFDVINCGLSLKTIGYFKYDNYSQCMQIHILKDIGDDGRILGLKIINYIIYIDEIVNIKIIDTIQENKLGLINGSSISKKQ